MADVEKLDTLKDRATEMLVSLIDSATQAGEFIKDQIPIVIRELLVFNTVKYVFLVLVFCALLAVSVWWMRHCRMQYKAAKSEWSDWDMAAIPAYILLPIALISLVCSVISLLKITLAPRVWLIEYATGLVR